MGHPLVGGVLDDRGVVLEEVDAQQPVVMRGLFARRNPQPIVIGIEGVRHGCLGCLPGELVGLDALFPPPAAGRTILPVGAQEPLV